MEDSQYFYYSMWLCYFYVSEESIYFYARGSLRRTQKDNFISLVNKSLKVAHMIIMISAGLISAERKRSHSFRTTEARPESKLFWGVVCPGWSDGLEKKNPLNNHIKVKQSRNIFSKWFTVLFIGLTQFLRVGCNKDFYLLFPVYQDFNNARGTSHAASKSESVHIRKWSLQSFTAWWTQRWEKCGYITQAVDIRCCLTLLGLIHQQFLRINLFLSLTLSPLRAKFKGWCTYYNERCLHEFLWHTGLSR